MLNTSESHWYTRLHYFSTFVIFWQVKPVKNAKLVKCLSFIILYMGTNNDCFVVLSVKKMFYMIDFSLWIWPSLGAH